MVDVIAWPPFGITGWELAEEYYQSRSVGLIGGRSRTSSARRPRRIATAHIAGVGIDQAGAGYVRMLARQWGNGDRLVRVRCMSSLWHLSRAGLDLRNEILTWLDGETELRWTSGGEDLIWGTGKFPASGVPVNDGDYFGLTVKGLPPNSIVARPSERITVTDGDDMEEALVMTVARSGEPDSNGRAEAVIRTDRATAFTVSGLVSIGDGEIVVFEALDIPRSVQTRTGRPSYQWNFREVFEDEYSGGFTEVDPWS